MLKKKSIIINRHVFVARIALKKFFRSTYIGQDAGKKRNQENLGLLDWVHQKYGITTVDFVGFVVTVSGIFIDRSTETSCLLSSLGTYTLVRN